MSCWIYLWEGETFTTKHWLWFPKCGVRRFHSVATFIFFVVVSARPIPHGPYFPYHAPARFGFPGGRAVNYLAHETEAFGDDLSSRISDRSQDVSAVGDEIQHATDIQSRTVEDIGREVDSDESMPFPASSLKVPFLPNEEDIDNDDDPSQNIWKTYIFGMKAENLNATAKLKYISSLSLRW